MLIENETCFFRVMNRIEKLHSCLKLEKNVQFFEKLHSPVCLKNYSQKRLFLLESITILFPPLVYCALEYETVVSNMKF